MLRLVLTSKIRSQKKENFRQAVKAVIIYRKKRHQEEFKSDIQEMEERIAAYSKYATFMNDVEDAFG
jgi:hypothetical protein